MSDKSKLPPQVINTWPEILKDIQVDVVPIEYLNSILIHFSNGKIWEIDIVKTKQNKPDMNLEDTLEEIFESYADSIQNVDFRLDTDRIKKDIKKRTHQFMKKRK